MPPEQFEPGSSLTSNTVQEQLGHSRHSLLPLSNQRRAVDVVHHQVHDHAGDRHVHPYRPGPAGDAPMRREARAQRSRQRENRQRNRRRRQQYVGDQDAEVHRADRAPPREANIADLVMVGDIAD